MEDATYEEALSVQLTRDRLEKWVNEVFFNEVVEVRAPAAAGAQCLRPSALTELLLGIWLPAHPWSPASARCSSSPPSPTSSLAHATQECLVRIATPTEGGGAGYVIAQIKRVIEK